MSLSKLYHLHFYLAKLSDRYWLQKIRSNITQDLLENILWKVQRLIEFPRMGDAESDTPSKHSESDGSESESLEDGANNSTTAAAENPKTPLTKNQQKKQRKLERIRANRKERRKAEKEKRKKRRAEAVAAGIDLGPSRKRLKESTMASSSCKIRVAVDLSFDIFMSEKDQRMTLKQLHFCYAANRRAAAPMQFYLVNFNGASRNFFDAMEGTASWDVHMHKESYTDLFPKEQLVYLTSESPNKLESLEEDKVYIIGGLIDHNQHKGLCHKTAEDFGIAHAQLPIDEYLDMKTRKVLAINHVFEILLRFTECKNWKDSLLAVIPKRKGAVDKE